MSAFTTFLNLVKPGGGSTGTVLPDEVVDVDKLNLNSDLIDAFAASWGPAASRNHNFYGPAASLAGITGMKLGDTYQESDGDKILWLQGPSGTWLVQNAPPKDLTLTSGWTPVTTYTPKYEVRQGLLVLSGRLDGTLEAAPTFGNLPSGYRPSRDTNIKGFTGSNQFASINVQSGGSVILFGKGPAVSDLWLDNIIVPLAT